MCCLCRSYYSYFDSTYLSNLCCFAFCAGTFWMFAVCAAFEWATREKSKSEAFEGRNLKRERKQHGCDWNRLSVELVRADCADCADCVGTFLICAVCAACVICAIHNIPTMIPRKQSVLFCLWCRHILNLCRLCRHIFNVLDSPWFIIVGPLAFFYLWHFVNEVRILCFENNGSLRLKVFVRWEDEAGTPA